MADSGHYHWVQLSCASHQHTQDITYSGSGWWLALDLLPLWLWSWILDSQIPKAYLNAAWSNLQFTICVGGYYLTQKHLLARFSNHVNPFGMPHNLCQTMYFLSLKWGDNHLLSTNNRPFHTSQIKSSFTESTFLAIADLLQVSPTLVRLPGEMCQNFPNDSSTNLNWYSLGIFTIRYNWHESCLSILGRTGGSLDSLLQTKYRTVNPPIPSNLIIAFNGWIPRPNCLLKDLQIMEHCVQVSMGANVSTSLTTSSASLAGPMSCSKGFGLWYSGPCWIFTGSGQDLGGLFSEGWSWFCSPSVSWNCLQADLPMQSAGYWGN